MAESVKVIDPNSGSGYDYTSLFDWEAAQQADIDTSNTIAVAKCRCTGGTADTTAVTIDGWTTSAADYIKVWTDPAESYRHNGTYQTGNKYRLQGLSTLNIKEDFVNIDGLQFYYNVQVAGSNSIDITGLSSTSVTKILNCIVRGPGAFGVDSTWFGGIDAWTTSSTTICVNCIIYDFYSTSSTNPTIGFGIYSYGADTKLVTYNCTAVNCTRGFERGGGTFTAKNCLAYECYDGFADITTTYCATDLAENLVGTGDRNSQTFTFEGASDFHLASNDVGALGYGLNFYNDAAYPFQTDIDGQDRGGAAASWDIGADEYVSSTAIEQEGFRHRNDDGDEATATWKANQDMNITLAADTAFRLRFLLKATGNPDSIDAQAEARVKPSGGAFGAWEKIN